jgi:hypothetical protein
MGDRLKNPNRILVGDEERKPRENEKEATFEEMLVIML